MIEQIGMNIVHIRKDWIFYSPSRCEPIKIMNMELNAECHVDGTTINI